MQGVIYIKLGAVAVPGCGGCGGPVTAVSEGMAVTGILMCAGCTRPGEHVAQGERLVAGLRREANALWLQLMLASGEELTYEIIAEIATSEDHSFAAIWSELARVTDLEDQLVEDLDAMREANDPASIGAFVDSVDRGVAISTQRGEPYPHPDLTEKAEQERARLALMQLDGGSLEGAG